MIEPTLPYLLIAESAAVGNQELEDLLAELSGQPGIDPYLARQRLIGRGPNLLAEGLRDQLEPSAAILFRRGWRCWLLPKTLPSLAPIRLRSLQISADALTFHTAENQIVLRRGSPVVAVLADLSGSIVGKALKHLMAQKVYNGIDRAQPIGDEELQQAIFRADPVLDLYFLGEQDEIRSALRILPGRFDPKGMGTSMSLSATVNLQRILQRVQDYASCTLFLDFGLANLPGCQVEQAGKGSPAHQQNLVSLSRFGWLASNLVAAGPFTTGSVGDAAGTTPPLGDLAYVSELLDEVRAEEPPTAPLATAAIALPSPPPRSPSRGLSRHQWLSAGGTAAAIGLFLVLENTSLARAFIRYGIRPGLVPAILAGTCLWAGFYFLRLKQRVENTPTSKTRSLAMGLVEVHGWARRKYALVSPMNQLPCVYYRLRRYRRDRNNRWRLSSSDDSGHVPFYLEDDTGRVLIDTRRAAVRPRNRQQGFGGQQTLLLERSSHRDRDQKWIEETIAEGTRLYILGQAKENRPDRPPLRHRVVEALRDLKKDPAALKQIDLNGDGQICEQEWSEARRQIEERLLHESLRDKSRSLPQQDRVIIGRPKQRSLPFIIAETASEAHLTRNYGFYSVPFFIGSLLSVAWTVVMLVRYLQLN